MVRDKFRIRFRKNNDLRLVSHHDLMRCFERMLRRAELPFHTTQGFNPKPRLVFALSLALGIEGCAEVVELELDVELPAAEVHERLARQAPAGLEIVSVRRIDVKASAQVERVSYRLAVPPERTSGLTDRVAELLAREECWIERTRPQTRRLNIRPYLEAVHILPDAVEIDLRVTPTGTVRPDEVLEILGLGDILAAGAVLQRIKLELHDELAAPGRDAPVRMCVPDTDESVGCGPKGNL